MDDASFLAFAGLNFAAALPSSVFRPLHWYRGLKKPPWTPPMWAFPLVWTLLYVAIAITGWLVWRAAGAAAAPALTLYALNLVLNASWSPLFFGLKRIDLALVEACALWASTLALIFAFAPISPLAAWLLAPYLLWVTVAVALNARILQLNGPRGAGR